MITPLGCVVTPFQDKSVPFSTSVPITCSLCGSYINSHIRIDRANRMWWCPICRKTTFLPEDFNLHEKNSPELEIGLEIRPSEHNTVDYLLPKDITFNSRTLANDFIVTYIIDLYQSTDSIELQEFSSLMNAIALSIRTLPANAQILLVTFSDDVEIHQPEIKDSIKITPESFMGDNDDCSKVFTDMSIIGKIFSRLCPEGSSVTPKKFDMKTLRVLLRPGEDLIGYLKSLKPKLTQSLKPSRSTGLAIFLAVLLCNKFSRPNTLGKIITFLGGPGTLNPGKIVSLNENIRSHQDIANFKAPHFTAASKFYKALGYISVGYAPLDAYKCAYSTAGKLVDFVVSENAPKFSVDIYTGSLDQVGIYEMRTLSDAGGGSLFISESFSSTHFQESLQRNFVGFLANKHICKLTLVSSRGVKVMKMVGKGTELQSSYQSAKLSDFHFDRISDTVTRFDSSLKKKNSTNQWHLGNVALNDTFAIFFEVEAASSSSKLNLDNSANEAFIQLQFKFWCMARNAMMLRIVTIKRPTSLAVLVANKVKLSNGNPSLLHTKANIAKERMLLEGFNANVWMTLLTRLLISKIDTSIGYENFDGIMDEVDRSLVKLLYCYGGVTVKSGTGENPHEEFKQVYSMSERFTILPDLAYNLRRNPQLISIFNSSPDETAFNHHIFSRCNPEISCRMISPKLYRVDNQGLVNLPLKNESLSISSRHLYFVLDCICHLIIFNQFSLPEDKLPLHHSSNDHTKLAQSNATFSDVFQTVKSHLLCDRSINPKIIVTQNGHSQARFLFSRLEPMNVIEGDRTEANPKWWDILDLFGLKRSTMKSDISFSQFNKDVLKRVKSFSMENCT